MISKSELKELFTDDILNHCISILTDKISVLESLYLHHLPNEHKQVLSFVASDNKIQKLLLLFREYIIDCNKQIVASISENVFDENKEKLKQLTKEVNKILGSNFDVEFVYQLFVSYMKTLTHFTLMLTFKCMGVDLQNDSNVSIDYGSLGTPGRIAKMWICKNIHDLTEPLSGRFAIEPELVVFPAKDDDIGKPVTVTLTINSMCSHHLFRFGTEFKNPNSKAIISYIPKDKVLGLSKINRWIEWIVRRGWLQEDLTKYIGEKLKKKLQTYDVYVGLINMQHGCVAFRGKNDTFSYTTTEYYSGKYENVDFRKAIVDGVS